MACACLVPFLGGAFHIDDPLFLWAAKHIVEHPGDPYGFSVNWYGTTSAMSTVTKNPPLTAYFLALVGSIAGWSEAVLHFAFLLPSIAVILGVYELARDMTRSPLLAACATLATPGFLVSATSVMCDVPMLALWLWAIIFWRKGIAEGQIKMGWLAGASILMGACALTKYFGMSLIPLLLLYSIWSKRRVGSWLACFLIPVAMLAGYQVWTGGLYDQGLLSGLGDYVSFARADHPASTLGTFFVALSFVGGCALPALFCIFRLWSRTRIVVAGAGAALGTIAIVLGWLSVEHGEQRWLLSLQLGLFILGGISAIWLALRDFWNRRDADSVLLAAWVVGSLVFAAFLNWTVNARSVLPLIPAVGLLIARRFDDRQIPVCFGSAAVPLALCLAISLWVTGGDVALANSARIAAGEIHSRGVRESKRILFSGHWGFQYYMELLGGQAIDVSQTQATVLDLLVTAENNTNRIPIQAKPASTISIPIKTGVTTMRAELGAGFYSSIWGPMPYVFAPVPDEGYDIFQVDELAAPEQRKSNQFPQ